MASKLPDQFANIRKFTWNYSKIGDGKGAPVTIEAACKKTADTAVCDNKIYKSLKKLLNIDFM